MSGAAMQRRDKLQHEKQKTHHNSQGQGFIDGVVPAIARS
jgi:hypothetical protein